MSPKLIGTVPPTTERTARYKRAKSERGEVNRKSRVFAEEPGDDLQGDQRDLQGTD